MPLVPGSRLGACEILSPLGAGGMGEVYRGLDTKLGREVALKILPESFVHDVDRVARFRREAQVLASLNHPNIAQIYSLDEVNGTQYLVLELVEGDTLAARLTKGPLALDAALAAAHQIADALGAAHDKGIVHRDLKPANIAFSSTGQLKVLDFGLAKGGMPSGPASDLTSSPTLTSPAMLTSPGVILGTLAYMSPEQAKGHVVDARADIWAFGCVVYEMLAGRPPFAGNTVADIIASILTREPDLARLPREASGFLQRFFLRSLEKDPTRRARTVRDIRLELANTSPYEAAPAQPERSIAVLPFAFFSDVEDRQALSLGFADALITMLGNLEGVAVAPTSAILRYAPSTEPSGVCRDLGVRQVLQGNVQRLAGKWRISVQIFDSATQRIALSEKYDFRTDDVFEVQDEIGRRVVAALEARFAHAAPRARDRYSSDPQAYAEFMAGLRESYGDSPEELQSAAQHLTKAVEHDPDFALAHAWLSSVCMQVLYYFDVQRTWLAKAERHCERALALDPGLPEGHWARAAIMWSPPRNFRHAEAIAALGHAIEARPNFDRAHNRMATICMHIGRFEEARLAHDLALKANPSNPSRNGEFLLLYTGDFLGAERAAEAWLREAPTNRSAHWFCPQPPLMLGQLDVAEQRLALALSHKADEPLVVSLQGMLHARRGEAELAVGCVRRALDIPLSFGHTHHTLYQVACVYAVLGEADKAMAWLERSVETGNPCWPFFLIDPHLEPLRRDVRFEELVAALEREYSSLPIGRL